MKRRRFIQLPLALAGTAALRPALAQDAFPSQTVRIIVATTPGTVMDISARLVAKQLEPQWKQSIVVINQPGAGGAIGTDAVAKAKPDGHTLLIAHEGILAIQPLIHKETAPRSDVRAVCPLTEIDLLLIVNRASGIRTLQEFIAQAKSRRMTYAPAGVGTPVHLRMEMIKQRLGIPLVHVPYKSTAAGLTDLVGKQVDCMLIAIGPAMPYLAEQLNVIATTGAKRSTLLPDVPTLAESYPNFSFTTWFGVFAPAETPDDIVEIASRDITAAIQAPAVKDTLLKQGIIPTGGRPAQLTAIVQKDFSDYARVIRTGHIDLSMSELRALG
jgi:tripartite-type tricarboxylate transporter receptor subunit TctC